jgi:hypothetical protein
MYHSRVIVTVLLVVFAAADFQVIGQTTFPEVLKKGSIKEQLNYLEERTKIYEFYRAIREDMFQQVKGNVSDTLSAAKNKIAGLNKSTSALNMTIDSLRADLKSTQTRLLEMTKTKNSISVLGLEVNKSTYNKFMWTILGGLIAILAIGFLAFKRNLSVHFSTKKEFQELKNEFEAYRKTSREAREKLTMDHFKEIQKLKGG